ncbi:unnamed protein product [Rhizophagus irregularis]|nr:unnamed protein product [Rhizophagus irregularis]
MLHNRFFGQVDDNVKQFLTLIMLGKQRLQMNQSGGLTILQSAVIETDVDNEEIYIGLREQEQDIRQTLFKSLIKDVTQETVLEVWHVRATGTSGIGYYVVLLNDAIYHITLISPCWYLKPDINQDTFLQQIPAITLCSTNNSNENLITNSTFNHLFSIRSTSSSITKSNKIIYARLFGLSKKVIYSAIKANMYQELMFKSFLYDIQNKFDEKQ